MESFLRDVDKRFKRGEISEEKMQRLVAEKVALNSKRRVKTIQAGDSKFYDEGLIFEDVCATGVVFDVPFYNVDGRLH